MHSHILTELKVINKDSGDIHIHKHAFDHIITCLHANKCIYIHYTHDT